MAYCSNCGQFVADGVKFCSNCGSPMNNGEDRTTRQQEFAGKIIKCPSCGTEIPSFTAICPDAVMRSIQPGFHLRLRILQIR